MSNLTPFLIANSKVGLERDLEPWMLPDTAYPELEDCYIFRGRVKKKQGYLLLGRLKRKIGTTDGAGNFSATLPNFPLSDGTSRFEIGTDTFQDPQATAGDPVTLLTNGAAVTKTLNRTTGLLTITNSIALTDVFYFPGLPVMGLRSLDLTTLNQTLLLAFDTKYSYLFNTSTKVFNDANFYRGGVPIVNEFVWSGTDYQFFWTTNYAGALWATNSVYGFQGQSTATTAASGDGIKWFDQDQSGWVNFLPPITGAAADGTGTTYLMGCLIIVPYKDRLVVLNTIEGADYAHPKFFAQRARWCQNGTPFNTKDESTGTAPTPTNFNGGTDSKNQSWSSDVVGKGGFIDAPTLEQIVSAEFVKDTLIVYFERSTWNLRYTGNEILPFVWEKINTELGATSTFSEVPFDKITIGVGDVGIHACDSVTVERIDDKIPDEVFAIQNSNHGRQRVYGIRDFFNELVYWTVPYVGADQNQAIDDEDSELPPPGVSLIYPNKIFVYNYKENSFSFFNDSFTCFGNYEKAADILWSDVTTLWEATRFTWLTPAGIQQFPFIVAGNQLGFVEIFDPQIVMNSDSLFISNITPGSPTTTIVVPNHNLTVGKFIQFTATSGINGILASNNGIFKVFSISDSNTFTIATPTAPTGVFTGNGTITIPSNINIVTKRFNPFMETAQQVRLVRSDLYFETTINGQVTVYLYIDEDSSLPINSIYNTVNTFPETTYQVDDDTVPFVNSKIWKRINFYSISQLFQLQITMSDAQMFQQNVVESDIVLHGMVLYFEPAGRLINV